jgi:hypothetical protein
LRYPLVGGTRERYFAGTNFKPRKVLENAATPTSRICFVKGRTRQIVREHSEIVSRPLSDPLFLEVGLAWNRKRYLSKTAKIFIESFRGTLLSAK